MIYAPTRSTILLGIVLGENVNSNVAKYHSLLIGLRDLILLEASHVAVYGDS